MIKVRTPRKLLAGAGLLSVLLGASMVMAPSATAHHAPVTSTAPTPTVVEGNATCPVGTVEFKFDEGLDIEGDSDTRDIILPGDTEATSVTISFDGYVVGGIRHYDWTSSESVTTVIVKQANSSAIFAYPAGTESGTAYVALVEGQPASLEGTSHISFCLDGFIPPPPTPGSLEVVKVTAGEDAPAAWSFGFSLSGDGVDEDFTLSDVDDRESFSELAAGTYVITETPGEDDTSTLTDVTCLDGEAVEIEVDVDGLVATVELAEGAAVVCTFTNTYPDVQEEQVTTTTTTTTTTTVTPTTPTTPTTAAAAVLGQQVVRTLPRTGTGTNLLSGLGVVLLGVGVAMVVVSRRRLTSEL